MPRSDGGWWGKKRTKNTSDFLVAGRRLGPVLYTGTMGAVILGGASTVGGVGLGYKFGISGMWLVVAIGVGVLLLGLFFAATIQKLKVYTVGEMLALRYGTRATGVSGIVMFAYTLMLCASASASSMPNGVWKSLTCPIQCQLGKGHFLE